MFNIFWFSFGLATIFGISQLREGCMPLSNNKGRKWMKSQKTRIQNDQREWIASTTANGSSNPPVWYLYGFLFDIRTSQDEELWGSMVLHKPGLPIILMAWICIKNDNVYGRGRHSGEDLEASMWNFIFLNTDIMKLKKLNKDIREDIKCWSREKFRW